MEKEYYQKYEPFFGFWHIKRFIGAGSYGKVFEIERRDEFDTVYTGALKAITIPASQSELDEILADGMDREGASTYFRNYVRDLNREIALMSKLKGHSNIVSYEDHSIFPHEDGVGWDILIRMELLTPITNYLKENHAFSRREVIRLGIDLCRALEICQRYNIIHRDIKPANIFISETEDFKLGDFGVARIASAATGASTRAGTVNYMAPEVFRGEKYTSNVDTYSLGLVMYQLLNNNRMPLYPPYPQPMTPNQRERAQAQRLSGAALPPPVNADGRLAEIVLKACAPVPADRYDSPAVMRQALEAILYTENEAKMIYPEGDTVPVPGTTEPSHPQAEPPVPEHEELLGADEGTIGFPEPPQEPAEPDAPAPAEEPAANAVRFPDRPAQPAGTEKAPEEKTERVTAVPPQAQPADKTVFLFKAQEEERRRKEEAARQAEEERRRKEAEAKEAELARIREEKRKAEEARRLAAEQAAKEEATRKAAAEQAAAAKAAQPEPAAPKKKNGKLPLVIGGVAVAAAVAVGGFALAGRGSSIPVADSIAASSSETVSEAAASSAASSASTSASSASSAAATELIDSGSCGENATWELYKDGTLYIRGSGAMQDYNYDYDKSTCNSPWYASHLANVKAVVIENGITRIGDYAFNECEAMKSVSIPDSVTEIGRCAFDECDGLTSAKLPSGLTSISDFLFGGCNSLKSIEIPSGVTSIGYGAFLCCTALESVTIPDSVESIDEDAFQFCYSLQSVTISRNCTLGEGAFDSGVQINYYD